MASEKRKKDKGRKDVSPVVKFFFTIGVLAVLLFIGVFLYDRIYNNPMNVVDEYIDAFMAKSPSRIFRTMDLKMTNFITPDNLDTLLEERANYHEITSYSLVREHVDNGDERRYKISYMVGRQESPFSQELILKKSDEKKLFILDNWYIDSSDLVGHGISIRVPTGARITVDGRKLGEGSVRTPDAAVADNVAGDENLVKQSGTTQDYEIGDMFVGKHEFEVTLDGFQPFSDTFEIEPQEYYYEPVFTVTPSQMTPDEESRKVAENLAQRMVTLLYQDLAERRSFDYFASEVAVEMSTQTALRKKYDELRKKHIDSETHLMYVEFDSFSSDVSSTLSEDSCYAVRVDTTIRYTAHSTVVIDDEPELKSASGSLKLKTVFHYSDGQWWLYDSDAFDKFIHYEKS
ncbi:MAG: hypothetical protein J5819_05265 [Eubacterium sp.]|nr:hypothetical protein [Eubacterium sp.]